MSFTAKLSSNFKILSSQHKYHIFMIPKRGVTNNNYICFTAGRILIRSQYYGAVLFPAHLVLLNFTSWHSQTLHFLQIAGWRRPFIQQVCWCHFSNSVCSPVSLGHILVIPTLLCTSSLLLHLWWWSVISGVTTVIVLGCQDLPPYKMVNLINKCVRSDCSIHWPFPHLLFFSSSLPILWDTTILKLGQWGALHWPRSVQVFWELHMPHFKSKARNDVA